MSLFTLPALPTLKPEGTASGGWELLVRAKWMEVPGAAPDDETGMLLVACVRAVGLARCGGLQDVLQAGGDWVGCAC